MLEGSRNHDSGKGAPSAELGIAKPDMRPAVQSYLDNLQAQVALILARYGVSSFEELKALGESDVDRIYIEDVTRLLALTHKIQNIVETGEINPEHAYDLTPFSYDKEKAHDYGFKETTIEAHPKAQEVSDAVFVHDPRFVNIHKAGSSDPDSTDIPPAVLTQDKIALNEQALKDFWQANCQDLPNVPEKSMWYFKALAEHRLSNTIDSDDPNNLDNPTSPLRGTYDQTSFMLTMDFNEFDYDNTADKASAITPQTKKILKTLFNTEDPTNITRDEINDALWSDHEKRTHTNKALDVIKELLGATANTDDFELRLMRPDEYQRSAQDQTYGQKNLYTHMDGYHAPDGGHRNGLLGGNRLYGGAADVGCARRSDQVRSFAVRLVLSRKFKADLPGGAG
jgi:hypothetical protein